MMKRATQQRKNYDDLGSGYENYNRFAQDMLKKKAEKYSQKDRVTL